MKYILLLVTISLLSITGSIAQQKHPKIVFDISAADTAQQATVFRQVNNVLKAAPQAQIEVVFHGKAVYVLAKDTTIFKERIENLARNSNITFAACNNSMKRLNISKDELLPSAIIVPVAILELADKQKKGWSYIKAGQ